jgi:hypothetical protein
MVASCHALASRRATEHERQHANTTKNTTPDSIVSNEKRRPKTDGEKREEQTEKVRDSDPFVFPCPKSRDRKKTRKESKKNSGTHTRQCRQIKNTNQKSKDGEKQNQGPPITL